MAYRSLFDEENDLLGRSRGLFSSTSFANQDALSPIGRTAYGPTAPEYNIPLDEEEEQGLIGKIASKSLEGVAYLGSVLDKTFGGRAVRGILGGTPREALSIIPFSDTLGITNPEEAVSGSDLNKKIGLDNVLGDGLLGTIGGLGTEILLDPGTYLTFGGSALTKRGADLAKYGFRPKDYAKAAKGFSNVNELRWYDDSLYNNLMRSPEMQPRKRELITPADYSKLESSGGLNDRTVYITDPAEYAKYTVDPHEIIKEKFIDQPLAGPIGAKIPFSSNRVALAGELGESLVKKYRDAKEFVGNTAGKAIDSVPYAREIFDQAKENFGNYGRILKRAFNYDVNKAVSPEGQAINSAVSANDLANSAMVRRDLNIFRNSVGDFENAPEFLGWASERGKNISDYMEEAGRGVISPSNRYLQRSLFSDADVLKKMFPDTLGKMSTDDILDKALNVYENSRNLVSGSIVDPTKGTSIPSVLPTLNRKLFDSGAIGNLENFSDPVYLGTGEVIARDNSSWFPRQINPDNIERSSLAAEGRGKPDSIINKQIDSQRTWRGLTSSLAVEQIMKDPEIAALRHTRNPAEYEKALKNAEFKIAVSHKGFSDAADYQKAWQDANYLKNAYGIEDINSLPDINQDTYKIIMDINNAEAAEVARTGLPLSDVRSYFTRTNDAGVPTNGSFVREMLTPAGGTSGKNFASNLSSEDLAKAMDARSKMKLYSNDKIVDASTSSFRPDLFYIDKNYRNRLNAAVDVPRIADVAANQSPFYLPKGTTNTAGELVENAQGAPYYQHPFSSFETRAEATGRALKRSEEVAKTYLGGAKIGQDSVGGDYDVSLRSALSSSGLKPEKAMNYFADNYRKTDRINDALTNPLPKDMYDHVVGNYVPRQDEILTSYADQFAIDSKGNIAIERIKNPIIPNGYSLESLLDEFLTTGVAPVLDNPTLEKETYRSLFRDFVNEASGVEAFIPKKTANNVREDLVNFSIPKPVGKLGRAIDNATQLLKGGLTYVDPAFSARNFFAGQLTNASTGVIGNKANPFEFFVDSGKANNAAMGGVIKGIAEELPVFKEANRVRAANGLPLLDDAAATKRFNEMMHEYSVYSPDRSSDVVIDSASLAKNVAKDIPGKVPLRSLGDLAVGFWDVLKKDPDTGKRTLDPLALWPLKKDEATGRLISKIEGNNLGTTGSVNETTFGPFSWGGAINTKVENANRGGAFYGFLRQGMHPEVAAQKVAESHVDYSKLTDFEKTYMKRMFPFYTFTRGMIPFVAKNITENPGGVLSQYTKIAGRLRDTDYNNELLPTHLGSSMVYDVSNIPGIFNPDRPVGTRTFFSGLDLPVDTVGAYIPNLFGDTPFRSAESLLGQMSPYIKAPLELATNRQFFGHRSLDDLYSPTGSRFVDQIVGNSPFSRIASKIRTLADERKTIPTRLTNALLGGRFTDIDMPKWESVRAREIVKEALAGSPGIAQYEKVYVRPGQENLLSPEQIELLRLQRTLENDARREKKLRQYNQLPQQPVYIRD